MEMNKMIINTNVPNDNRRDKACLGYNCVKIKNDNQHQRSKRQS
jgi:hypothetical protein